MFDQPLKYILVHVNRNKYKAQESFNREFIYKFYRHNYKCCIKYIVSIKEYDNKYLTLDFYPKIRLTPKLASGNSVQDLRYRMLTKQNSFGFIGATILEIISEVQLITNIYTWGFLAANLLTETSNHGSKRFNVYSEILNRTFMQNQKVFVIEENSAIFVIPNKLLNNTDLIFNRYEHIFEETN